ncbi:DUF3710 domain-containing protein [Streptomyces sp. NBC_01232]|uniref:DUF3710 domain-containing protein n=1 Tax=Streptomyces sp. NBC_01232 TaxID=2903786 RepID=UPI003FA3C800
MSPKREIKEGTAAGDLAGFLVRLTRGATVRELSDRFGKSSSTWGNYLNGAQLIPQPLLGKLVEAYTVPGAARNVKAVRASELWAVADRERRGTPTGVGLVRQHQRRDDALQQVIKYQGVAANAEKHLAELRPMLAYTQSRLENTQLQLQQAGERERVRIERQLSQARERLSRVTVQQERARNRRMTAEEQQEFWMAEALTAQDEINRLEHEARDLVVPQDTLIFVQQTGISVDDTDFDIRLEHIAAEGLEDDVLIETDLDPDADGPAHEPTAEASPQDRSGPSPDTASDDLAAPLQEAQETVQPLSNPFLDNPAAARNGAALLYPLRPEGPWDVSEVSMAWALQGGVDLGGLIVPAEAGEGKALRVEVAGDDIVAVTLIVKDSAIQLQAFAASGRGIWDAIREEIRAGIIQAGGTADEVFGALGRELRANVLIELPDGARGMQQVRFVGADGPGWFLRAVISGHGAVHPQDAKTLEEIFCDTVVVRGDTHLNDRDPIVLRLPDGAQLAPDSQA